MIRLLPRRVILFLGDAAGEFWFHVVRFRRGLAIDNLRYALRLNEAEATALARRNFRHYGRLLVEFLETATWKKEDFLREVSFDYAPSVEPYLRGDRAVIFLCSHIGNWELALRAGAAFGLPIDVIVKRPRNRLLEGALRRYRQRTGAGILAETGTAKDILRSLSRHRAPVFLLDQFMGPPIGLPVTFFGRPAGTAVALALITEKRDVPVIPVCAYRDEAGRHHVEFLPPIDGAGLPADKNARLYRKTQSYNDAAESLVRRHPDQWLWIHRRWKEFRGEPRWLMAAATAAVILFLAAGCSSKPGAPETTGIPIPSDLTIEVPKVKVVDKPTDNGDDVRVTIPTPVPTPTAAPEPLRKKKRKTAPPKAAAAPAPSGTDTSLLEVVNADKVPFAVGERMEIELSYMGLTAGRVVMEVREGQSFSGRPTLHLWGNALSSSLVDHLYHVDNTIETYVDSQALIPYKFLLHMVESPQTKETRVLFDHIKHKAYYWSKRLSKKWGDENQDRTDAISPLAKDMYSGVYFARSLNYVMGKKVIVPIYENAQNMDAELVPVANEIVRTPAGVFQCWKLQLTLKLNNVLKPTGDLFLWLSDDSKRYVVKFDAKLKIGSLYGNLVAVRERQ